MASNAHNSLIITIPTNCTGSRREAFLFVFNSFASLCRKFAAVFVSVGGNIFGQLALIMYKNYIVWQNERTK